MQTIRMSQANAPMVHSDDTPPNAVIHLNDLPPVARPAPPSSGNARADQKYQQQQDKLTTKQTQQRQSLQQKQESERRSNANPAQTQQQERRHYQQTQQLSQKHQAQQQFLKAHQPQAKPKKQP